MSTKDCTTASTEIHLAAGEVWSGKATPGLQIACKRGIVWLTQSDDSHDYLLHPGQRFLATYHGKVVVQALTGESCYIVTVRERDACLIHSKLQPQSSSQF